MAKIIVGVAGRMASGKGTVADYLIKNYHAKRYRSSDPLRETLDIFDLPQSRDNLGSLSTFVRSAYGEDVIARAVMKAATSSDADIALFDGMRRLIDVETFRGLPHFRFIFVDTDQGIRYERYTKRNENPGDGDMDIDKFHEVDSAEPEQQIDDLKKYADFVINNNGTPEEFNAQLSLIVSQVLSQ